MVLSYFIKYILSFQIYVGLEVIIGLNSIHGLDQEGPNSTSALQASYRRNREECKPTQNLIEAASPQMFLAVQVLKSQQ